MEERFLTRHPEGKQGVNISKAKYDRVRQAILDVVETAGEITFKDLVSAVEGNLGAGFDGSPGWYTTTVKLDLEARSELERVPGSQPQKLRLPK